MKFNNSKFYGSIFHRFYLKSLICNRLFAGIKTGLFLFVAGILLISCSPTGPDNPPNGNDPLNLDPGINDVEIDFDGLTRELYILLPEDYQAENEYPLIFFFHGLGGNREWGRDVLGSLMGNEDFVGISP